jgi:hypothetical protein
MKHPYFWGEVERGRFIGFSMNGKSLYELLDLMQIKDSINKKTIKEYK